MLKKRDILLSFLAAIFVFGGLGLGQDSQSLADAARQARLKKQQQDAATNDPQGKDSTVNSVPPAKAPRVITNDEIPSHEGPISSANSSARRSTDYAQPAVGSGKGSADSWKQQILAQKSRIASLETEMARVNESVRFASGNCVANCVQHNERQIQKQQQVEAMKSQLEEMQKQLEQMQETARRQGFGSSVYDP